MNISPAWLAIVAVDVTTRRLCLFYTCVNNLYRGYLIVDYSVNIAYDTCNAIVIMLFVVSKLSRIDLSSKKMCACPLISITHRLFH